MKLVFQPAKARTWGAGRMRSSLLDSMAVTMSLSHGVRAEMVVEAL